MEHQIREEKERAYAEAQRDQFLRGKMPGDARTGCHRVRSPNDHRDGRGPIAVHVACIGQRPLLRRRLTSVA
jgi:hypothetical protein